MDCCEHTSFHCLILNIPHTVHSSVLNTQHPVHSYLEHTTSCPLFNLEHTTSCPLFNLQHKSCPLFNLEHTTSCPLNLNIQHPVHSSILSIQHNDQSSIFFPECALPSSSLFTLSYSMEAYLGDGFHDMFHVQTKHTFKVSSLT